jgi:hypothetical protein
VWWKDSGTGRERGGKVGDGRPYELVGDIGADMALGLLTNEVVIREVRRECGVAGVVVVLRTGLAMVVLIVVDVDKTLFVDEIEEEREWALR